MCSGGDAFLKLLFETAPVKPGNLTLDTLENEAIFWSYREQISVEHMERCLNNTDGMNHAVLKAFMQRVYIYLSIAQDNLVAEFLYFICSVYLILVCCNDLVLLFVLFYYF